jgi:hypothetical protein
VKCMFGQKYQGKALKENVFKVNGVRVTYLRARYNMVRQIRSRVEMVM